MIEREGRGRLSSIELLPEDADPDILWANEELRNRTMPAKAILDEFNARLADRGLGPISKSAWGRYAMRKAVQFRKHDEARRMSAELVAQLGAESADDVTVMVAELLKVAMFELLEKDAVDSKSIMELSRSLQSVVSAQRGSEEYRRKLQQRADAQVETAIDRAGDMAREAGLSEDRVAQIRRDVLGVRA